MKQNPQPQLMAEIEQNGYIEYSIYALKNAYFRGEHGWENLLAWADEHGFTVRPRSQPEDMADLVKISE